MIRPGFFVLLVVLTSHLCAASPAATQRRHEHIDPSSFQNKTHIEEKVGFPARPFSRIIEDLRIDYDVFRGIPKPYRVAGSFIYSCISQLEGEMRTAGLGPNDPVLHDDFKCPRDPLPGDLPTYIAEHPNPQRWRLTYNETIRIFLDLENTFMNFEPIPDFSFWVWHEDSHGRWGRVAGGNYHNPPDDAQDNLNLSNLTSPWVS